MSSLTDQIDQAAIDCCIKMTETNAKKFFSYQKKRIKEGEFSSLSKKSAIEVYYKGPRKGQMREVYEVDGKKFNLLWSLLQNYAFKSSSRSNAFSNNGDIEEDVMEIRYLTFRALRFFGSHPNNLPFSKYFSILVNNVLTNSASKRLELVEEFEEDEDERNARDLNSEPVWFNPVKVPKYSQKTQMRKYRVKAIHNATSIFTQINKSSSDDESICLLDCISQGINDIEFNVDIPSNLKESILMLIGGYKLAEVAKMMKMKKCELKMELEKFAIQR